MKAIITRYLPCTNTKGSRIVATDGDHNRVVIGYDSASDNPHADAALALCRKLNWTGTLVEGGLGDGRCVFVFDEHSERHAI